MKDRKESSKESRESKEKKNEVVVDVVEREKVDHFVDFFNSEMCRTQAVIPMVDTLSPECAAQVAELLQKYPMDKLEKMATMAAKSDFLNGGGQRGFKADIEWLTRERNFLKVINGKYNNIPAHRRWHDTAEERRSQQEEQRRRCREIEEEERLRRQQERDYAAAHAATPEQIKAIMANFKLP